MAIPGTCFCVRGNLLVRKYNFPSVKVRFFLFKKICYSINGATLWSRYNTATMKKLKVCYNIIFGMLLGYPLWHRARRMFVSQSGRSFDDMIMINDDNDKFIEDFQRITHMFYFNYKNAS